MCLQMRFVAKIKRKKVNLKEEYFKVKYLTAGNEKKGTFYIFPSLSGREGVVGEWSRCLWSPKLGFLRAN